MGRWVSVLVLLFAGSVLVSFDAAEAGETGKLDAHLSRLIEVAAKGGASPAEELAKAHGLHPRRVNEELYVEVVLEPPKGRGARTINQARIKELGAEVACLSRSFMLVQAPLGALTKLGELPDVRVVRAPIQAAPVAGMGTYVSESVALTGADQLQAKGVNGAGVKVAVVDLGFTGLASAIAAGELPANTVTWNFVTGTANVETTTNHGAAVSEHVMDMAPGATLYCLLVGNEVHLQNAADYIAANGIRIANHSVAWVNASYYDDSGVINDIINESHDRDGVFWAVASGNYATRHWGGNWSSDVDGWLHFSGTDDVLSLTTGTDGSTASVFLNWNQYGYCQTNLDLYVYDKDSNLITSSTAAQIVTSNPTERADFTFQSGQAPYKVKVRRISETGSLVRSPLNVTVFTWGNDLNYAVASGSVMDPASSHGGFTVGAIDQATWGQTTPPPDYYSSQGPTTNDRTKPDIAAPDRTRCYTYGGGASWGTSFASPTTAGAAALLLQQVPSLSANALASKLEGLAQDIGVPGKDSVYGAGKLHVGTITAPPTITITNVTTTPSGAVERYAMVEFTVTLANVAATRFYCSDPDRGGLDLSATFTGPDASTWPVSGFYDGDTSTWRIRFAPGVANAASWNYSITARDPSGTSNTWTGSFTCQNTLATPYPGWVRIDGNYLRFTEGQTFFGVGHNTGWQDSVTQPSLSAMASQGLNLLSFWIAAPWKQPSWDLVSAQRAPMENFEQALGNYSPKACTYLDGVVQGAEGAGVYLLPTLWSHGQLRDYYSSFGAGWWYNNAYNEFSGAEDFFRTADGTGADTAQWRFQKDFYRYLIARWGYSRAIVGWVLVCEIDGTKAYHVAGHATLADAWCRSVRDCFVAHDPFRLNAGGQYPLAVTKVDTESGTAAATYDVGLDLRAMDSYGSAGSDTGVASTLATQTATMRSSGKPCFHAEFGGDVIYGASQPTHLHNGIWAATASGSAMTPLVWCDGGDFPMLTQDMVNHLDYLRQFVAGISYQGDPSLVPATASVSVGNNQAWGMRLSDRGFVWIQNTAATQPSGNLTVSSLLPGQYQVEWFNVWPADGASPPLPALSPFQTDSPVTVSATGQLVVAIPTTSPARNDLACRFVRTSGPTTGKIWTGAVDSNWSTNNSGNTNWVGNGLPANNDLIVFNSSSTKNLGTSNDYGTTLTGLAIRVADPTGAVSISGNSFSLGAGGIDMIGATRSLTISAPVTVGAPQTWDVQSGGLSLTTGRLTLSADLSIYTTQPMSCSKPVTVSANLLLAGNQAITFSGDIIQSGGNRTLTVNSTGPNTFSGSALSLTNSGTARTLTLGGTRDVTVSSAVANGGAGAGYLTYNGSGTLTLSGNNTYTGTTTVNRGTLKLGHVAALGGTTGSTVVNSPATLDLNGLTVSDEPLSVRGAGVRDAGALVNTNTTTPATFTGVGGVTLAGETTFGGAGNVTLSGVLSGSYPLTKTGAGSLTLSGAGANTNAALTTINNGTLILGKSAGTNAIAGNLTIAGGTAQLGAANQIPDTATVRIEGSTFDLNHFNETIAALVFNHGTLTSTGGAATLTLAGNTGAELSIRGGLTIPAGVNLAFSNTTSPSRAGITFDTAVNGTATIAGGVNLNSSGTTGLSRTFSVPNGTADQDLVIIGVVSSTTSTGLIKDGGGTLVLGGSGDHTYGGATNVLAGTLMVNRSLAASANAVSVSGTATLRGTATINRPVTPAAGAIIWPGSTTLTTDTKGALTIVSSSAVDFSSGGRLTVRVSGGPGALQADRLLLSGAGGVTLGGSSVLGIAYSITGGTYSNERVMLLDAGGERITASFGSVSPSLPVGCSVIYVDAGGNTVTPSVGTPAQYVYFLANGSPTPVRVAEFVAEGAGGGALLKWACGSELENAGFRVWRRVGGAGEEGWKRRSATLIPGALTTAGPTEYAWYDKCEGGAYEYRLESVSTAGTGEFYGKLATVTVEGGEIAAPDKKASEVVRAAYAEYQQRGARAARQQELARAWAGAVRRVGQVTARAAKPAWIGWSKGQAPGSVVATTPVWTALSELLAGVKAAQVLAAGTELAWLPATPNPLGKSLASEKDVARRLGVLDEGGTDTGQRALAESGGGGGLRFPFEPRVTETTRPQTGTVSVASAAARGTGTSSGVGAGKIIPSVPPVAGPPVPPPEGGVPGAGSKVPPGSGPSVPPTHGTPPVPPVTGPGLPPGTGTPVPPEAGPKVPPGGGGGKRPALPEPPRTKPEPLPPTEGRTTLGPVAKVVYREKGLLKVREVDLPAGFDAGQVTAEREGQAYPILARTTDGLLLYAPGYEDEYTDRDAIFLRPTGRDMGIPPAPYSVPGLFAGQEAETTTEATATERFHEVWYNWGNHYGDGYYYEYPGWFSRQYLTDGSVATFTVSTPGAKPEAGTLSVDLWSFSNVVGVAPDHKLQAVVNGQGVGEVSWDGGHKALTLSFAVPAGVLKDGANTVELVTPVVAGVSWQFSMVYSVSLSYTRKLESAGALAVAASSGAAAVCEAKGLGTEQVYVVDKTEAGAAQLVGYEAVAAGDGTWTVRFERRPGREYLIVPAGGEVEPQSVALRYIEPLRGRIGYLAVGGAEFEEALSPLLERRTAEGLGAVFADQERLFDAYGYGRYGPEGIRRAVRAAVPAYLLLVGRTTYDYRNYEGQNLGGGCPTLFAATSTFGQSPGDAQYGDLGRGYPEVAVGRYPANNAADLSVAVARTLSYTGRASASGPGGLMVADRLDPSAGDFAAEGEELIGAGPRWAWERSYLGVTEATAGEVTARLTEASGWADVITFVGHGSSSYWAKEVVLDAGKAGGWSGNVVLVQATCNGNYFLHNTPGYGSIAKALLFKGGGGVAASVGSGTWVYPQAMVPVTKAVLEAAQGSGVRWGEALLAGQRLAAERAQGRSGIYDDLAKSECLLGDPALPVEQAEPEPAPAEPPRLRAESF